MLILNENLPRIDHVSNCIDLKLRPKASQFSRFSQLNGVTPCLENPFWT